MGVVCAPLWWCSYIVKLFVGGFFYSRAHSSTDNGTVGLTNFGKVRCYLANLLAITKQLNKSACPMLVYGQ